MTLVIMAAGMGSRYGGLKQLDPIGKNGEFIIDYSIYDAIKAGFDKVVFIIKEENLDLFRDTVGRRIEKNIKVSYVFQTLSLNNFDTDIELPPNRVKPWGTAHAVLSCSEIVNTPFAVINADDYYGKESFELLADFLKNVDMSSDKLHFAMIGFVLANTLTENGHVARGVCKTDDKGYLLSITERTKIQRNGNDIQYEENDKWTTLADDTIVSMNCWAFTPQIFKQIREGYPKFLNDNRNNLEKAEYFIPFVVEDLIKKDKCDVKVIPTKSKWYGVTYKQDKEKVVEFINKMIDNKVYSERLWNDVRKSKRTYK